jgi:diacylglycerol kinase family enzyme
VDIRLIANPIATGVTPALIDRVARELGRAGEVEVRTTEHAGHAAELAAEPGADVLVAMGGDGTANELVNGAPPGSTVAVLPAGATSVFARQLGLPNRPLDAARLVTDAIRAGHTQSLGLGEANGRMFTFSAGMGLEAEAMRLVEEERELRADGRRPSDLRVVRAALQTLRSDGFTLPERMTVDAGGRSMRASYVAVANHHPYTYFGRIPVRTAPRAGFGTALDVAAARELRTRDLWRLPLYGLVWPRHARGGDPRIAYLHDVPELDVTADEPLALQLDGEYLGRVDRVELRYRPDRLRVVTPRPGASARGRGRARAGT